MKIRKIFDVIIHNTVYGVYDIEGKEHEGYNDTPKTWWLYYSSTAILAEGVTPSLDSDSWKPYCVGIQRRLWDIQITQRNTTKEKWGDTNFRNHTHVEMWCNKKLIYSFGTTGNSSGLAFAFAKIQYLQIVLSEHCYNFFDAEKENGRKIYWKGLPATVRVKGDTWEIAIIPDYECGLSKEQWWAELKKRETKIGGAADPEFDEMEKEDFNDSERSDYINWGDALSDGHIDWFRK